MVNLKYTSKDDFIKKNDHYAYHTCECCNNINEMDLMDVNIQINTISLIFRDLPVLKCETCSHIQLPINSSKMILYFIEESLKNNQTNGDFRPTGYNEHYDYCENVNFNYDHRDYETIPRLAVDQEHSKKGFLTPVFFNRKVLLYFANDDEDYDLNLFSETYGYLQSKNSWGVPFGINSNGKVVFWLGDIDTMDEQTQRLLLPHNVSSDHKIIKSEFYAAQMCCIWSEPNLEKRIFEKRRTLIKELNDKYNIDISQLPEEVSDFEEKFQKPIIFTESGIKTSIEILQKINVEAFNCGAFSLLYEILYPKEQRNKSYGSWKSIKHMESLLLALYPNIKEEKKRELMSPLYLLNDFRIYYDHLVSTDKKNETKNNILNSLELTDFSDLKTIYETIVNRLLILYDYYLTAL